MENRIHRIHPVDIQVVQKAPGGISPRFRQEFGLQMAQEYRRRLEEEHARVYNRVAAERAEAVARGVSVVVDDTRPDHYQEIHIPD
jgi:hypothetical protein